MECLVGRGAVCCSGVGIGTSVAAERQHRSGAKECVLFKTKKNRHLKQFVNGASVSP